jgi:hypothetical protein
MASSFFRRDPSLPLRRAWIGTQAVVANVVIIGATVDVSATVSADLAVVRPIEAFIDVLALVQASPTTAAQAYVLPANAGSYGLTGTTLDLRQQHVVSLTAGSLNTAGSAATLTRGPTMVANAGSIAHTGSTTVLFRTRGVLLTAGVHSVAGSLLELSYAPLVPTVPVLRVDAALREFDQTATILLSLVTVEVRDFDKVAELA